ncbi:uncharacterized protein [Leptinotarsa decemlineata]|uniref:uncharacterized protein n=1 Tax=Leptinotarsa decemlineata TaxID=7539 RepID=UPI003D30B1CE
MNFNIRSWFLWGILALCSFLGVKAGGGHGGEHVVIKIPEHIHTVKHTHTIYKTIHHKHHGGGGEDYHSHGGKPFHWH